MTPSKEAAECVQLLAAASSGAIASNRIHASLPDAGRLPNRSPFSGRRGASGIALTHSEGTSG